MGNCAEGKCKCGGTKFFIEPKGNATGLYCAECGKWQKWLSKKDVRLFNKGLLKLKTTEEQKCRTKTTNNKSFLNQMSPNYLFDVQLTNLEWVYVERVVLKNLRSNGNLIPSKEDILKYILEKAMANQN